jgi:hypothetical protein
MKRIIYTVLVCAAFLTMLTATSKKHTRPPRDPVTAREAPATTDWTRNEVHGNVFLTPPGAVVDRDTSSASTIRMRIGGVELDFVHGVDSTRDPVEVRRLHEKHPAVYGYFVEAPDAVVIVRWDDSNQLPKLDEYCEVIACSAPIADKRFCTRAAYHPSKKAKLSHAQCMEVVTIARSITRS